MIPIVLGPGVDRIDAAAVRARRDDVDVRHPENPAALVAELERESDPLVLLCKNSTWRDEYLPALSAGDWVQTTTSGHDNYPVEAFADRGIAFTNAPSVTAPTVADHALSLLLSVTRKLSMFRAQQDAHVWMRRRGGLTDLAGETCCVVGLGEIGERVASRASAFETTVRGVKRSTAGYDGAADEVFSSADLGAALSGASVLFVCAPLTAETRGVIGEDELAALADGAVVVNVSRGPIVRTEALIAALDAGTVRAAALDVVDPEPLPVESPLWDRPDVLITPHNAGGTEKFPARMLDLLFEQYDRRCAGKALRNQLA